MSNAGRPRSSTGAAFLMAMAPSCLQIFRCCEEPLGELQRDLFRLECRERFLNSRSPPATEELAQLGAAKLTRMWSVS